MTLNTIHLRPDGSPESDTTSFKEPPRLNAVSPTIAGETASNVAEAGVERPGRIDGADV